MNIARSIGHERTGAANDGADPGVGEAMFDLGGDERRMHVRAYHHWVSLLHGRPYPSIADLDPHSIADFGAHSVLLDFSSGIDNPAIAYLGSALREECAIEGTIARVGDVPARSLLSRLTDHYLQIIANRAPIGFEAEFTGNRGRTTLYRGILMPFSSDGETIDFIYGVINWKEMVGLDIQCSLDAELAASLRAAPAPGPAAPVWADGPSAGMQHDIHEADEPLTGSLADHLAVARESAAVACAADTRSRVALYRALGRAHDFALAVEDHQDDYRALLDAAGITATARSPLTPLVKLVFGIGYDKTRLAEFVAVLAFAQNERVAAGALTDRLAEEPGGIKAIVAAQRAARHPNDQPRRLALAERSTVARLSLSTGTAPGAAVVLLARVGGDGMLDILGSVAEAKLADRVCRALA